MTEQVKSEENEDKEEKLDRFIKRLPWSAFIIGTLFLIPYLIIFRGGFSVKQTDWGAFGDFIAGVMGVVIGLLTLMVLGLAYTTQRRELKATLKELKYSREEQKRATDVLREQNLLSERRVYLSELMEATRHLHDELKLCINETKIKYIGMTLDDLTDYKPFVSLKEFKDILVERKYDLSVFSDYECSNFNVQPFLGLISQLAYIHNEYSKTVGGERVNPLIQSIINYWTPAVSILNSFKVAMDDEIRSVFKGDALN
ncbi:MAG TPA: hypothetical protein VIM93_00460 [Kangiella sp.]